MNPKSNLNKKGELCAGAGASLVMVTALPSEARPVIERFSLKPDSQASPYRLYGNKDQTITLVVSGVGKTAMAAAMGYVQGRMDNSYSEGRSHTAWLNLGIAGSGRLDIGAARLVHKVVDEATARSWYPPVVFAPPVETASVKTVDVPVENYHAPEHEGMDLFDMEASAFVGTAQQYSPAELVHLFKIVSDNPERPIRSLDRTAVTAEIANSMGQVQVVVEALLELSAELASRTQAPAGLAACKERMHLSVTQERHLVRLLRQWSAVFGHDDPLLASGDKQNKAGTFLEFLEQRLAQEPWSP